MRHLPRRGTVPDGLARYMSHYFEIICAVSSTLSVRAGTDAALDRKDALWDDIPPPKVLSSACATGCDGT